MVKRNTTTGRWISYEKGIKTERQKSLEEKLGHSLEEDWQIYYLGKEWGWRKMTQRWGLHRISLFGDGRGRQGWVGHLGLKTRKEDADASQIMKTKNPESCEICGESSAGVEESHYVRAKDGGPKDFFNILNLCPNCHKKLDAGNEKIAWIGKSILMERAKKSYETRLPPWRWEK